VSKILFPVLLFSVVFLFVGYFLGQQRASISPVQLKETPTVSTTLAISIPDFQKILPEGVFIRETASISGIQPPAYVVLYIEKSYQIDPEATDYHSCPQGILGQAINGIYHLALYQSGTIKSDIKLPGSYNIYNNKDFLALAYRNAKYNLYPQATFVPDEDSKLEQVKLLNFEDMNGDGKPYELLFTTTAGGCGFFDGLVIGFDPNSNTLKQLSDWWPRFHPDSAGNFYYLFECGDHGNQTRNEAWYTFDPKANRYKVVNKKDTPCEQLFPLKNPTGSPKP
jgi:hypothetical protein